MPYTLKDYLDTIRDDQPDLCRFIEDAILKAYRDATMSLHDQENHGDHLLPTTHPSYLVTKAYYEFTIKRVNTLMPLIVDLFPDSFEARYAKIRPNLMERKHA